MSQVMEDRALRARPLCPADRMILFWIARLVPDGRSEVLINRAHVARDLQASPEMVRHALGAGESLGLCRVLRNGRVAFCEYDAPLGEEPRSLTSTAVTPVSAPTPVEPRLLPGDVMREFSERWQEKYRQRYHMTSEHFKWAKELRRLSLEELRSRIEVYLTHPDPFWRECKHAFTPFARNINRWIRTTAPLASPGVPDAAATQRYLRRMEERG
jgi:hypothetical protein